MNGNSSNESVNDILDNGVIPPHQRVEKAPSSSCSSYSIEVCQGPDCTGLGGGIAILEIEELVREYEYNIGDRCTDSSRIRVVAGGCRDFCSVGPNAHILVRDKKKQRGKPSTSMLESFQAVSDAPTCDSVVRAAIAYAASASSSKRGSDSPDDPGANAGENTRIGSQPSPMNHHHHHHHHHRSMMARRAERMRWEALKDVSRTIAKSKRSVATSGTGIERKLRIWKETCHDRIGRATPTTTRPSPRDQRRTERLIEIASEKLDRICLQFDEESDSSGYSSSDHSDTDDE